MEQKGRTEKRVPKGLLACLLLGLALVLAVAAALLFTMRVGGRLVLCAPEADVRGLALSCEDYDEAAGRRPGTPIRWSVPIGDERYDSYAEELSLASLPEDQVERLAYFPNLRRVDAESCGDYAALALAARRFPDVSFSWHLPSADGPVDGNTPLLEVHSLGADELEKLTALLPMLRRVDLRQSGLSDREIDAYAERHGELEVLFTVPLWGMELSGSSESLRLDAGVSGDADELALALSRLTHLKKLDLRDCALTPRELQRALSVCRNVETDYVIRLFGQTYLPDCEELDLSGIPVDDTGEIEAAVTLMPKLKKVIMCDCGVPDDEMDALNRRFENVRFVWTVYFSVYALRTDATMFCASDVPFLNYLAPELNDAQVYPIRYCTDLEALDLGHMWFSDLSFLYEMPKLKILILVEGRFHDITPIGSLEDLEYLEIFMNRFDDISPLLNCKKLKHLNICYCTGFDLAPLAEMKQLERLWYAGLGPQRGAFLVEALPDTECYFPYTDPDGSTGGGWRETETYFQMRDVFAMYYQPGGTGVH